MNKLLGHPVSQSDDPDQMHLACNGWYVRHGAGRYCSDGAVLCP